MNLRRPTLWRAANAASKNHVGYPGSHQPVPGGNAATLLSADDWPRRRVRFIDRHLWVTPQRDDERWAAGDHPTLSASGMGLPAWTAANRPIADADIVLWHAIGMHHLARARIGRDAGQIAQRLQITSRAEDWPVMPAIGCEPAKHTMGK